MYKSIYLKKIGFTAAVALWMMVIFFFSAKPADESEDMSHSVGRVIGKILVSDYSEWSKKEQQDFAGRIDYPVRKAAHASEYAVLGFLLMGMANSFGLKGAKRLLECQAAGTIYAATDEFHQLFVPGRSGQLTDVMIDSAGVFAGLLLFFLLEILLGQGKKHKIGKN